MIFGSFEKLITHPTSAISSEITSVGNLRVIWQKFVKGYLIRTDEAFPPCPLLQMRINRAY